MDLKLYGWLADLLKQDFLIIYSAILFSLLTRLLDQNHGPHFDHDPPFKGKLD
jgi:hypothetical protein